MTTLSTEIVQEFDTFLRSFNLSGDEQKSGMILLTALYVGADDEKVAEATGFDVDFVKERGDNLRNSGIWVDGVTHANWEAEPTEFLIHIGVAEGLIRAEHAPTN